MNESSEIKRVGRPPPILKALLWKNIMLKRKRKTASFFEIFAPLFFLFLVLALKSQTDVAEITTGWTEDRAEYCPYTGKKASSQIVKVVCPLPYERYYRELSTFQEIQAFISGTNTQHEFAKIFFVHSGEQREINAVNMFIDWVEAVGIAETGPVVGFRNSSFIYKNGSNEALEEYIRSSTYGMPFSAELPEVAAAIGFNSINFDLAQFDYTLRLNSSSEREFLRTPPTLEPPVNALQKNIDFDINSFQTMYIQQGFSSLQQLIDSFFIAKGAEFYTYHAIKFDENVTAERKFFEPSNIAFVAFPIRSFEIDYFFKIVKDIFPLIFILTYLSPVSQTIYVIVLEKEVKAKEMMKLMGVSEYHIILSWYITYFVYFLALAVIIAAFGFILFPATTKAAHGFSLLILCCFLVFGLATIAFCFVVSTFFTKSFNAVVFGLMVYVMLFFSFYSFNDLDTVPNSCLLIPQVAFAFLMQALAEFEQSTVGVSISLLFFEVRGFSVGKGLLFLLFDYVYLTCLGFYLNAVIPGEYGSPMPFYFIFNPFYYKKLLHDIQARRKLRKDNLRGYKSLGEGLKKSPIEPFSKVDRDLITGVTIEPANANLQNQLRHNIGLQIRNLTKVFQTSDGEKIAVDNLDLDVFEGQILVLLGHNGAGKTTTLQILTGMIAPTKGDAFIYGKSICTDMNLIRNDLGFCPQHDVLYNELTVYDHLKFYGSIKGLSGEILETAINRGIEQVGLLGKKFSSSASLSGGMKRKLSLAISLVGNSKVVFIDEPTSGVDPWSRRAMWEVLQNCRDGRVIILTTHFMDEADLLGDRIAIMAEGKLQCVGSTLFLKQLYGAGYQLTFVKDKGCVSAEVELIVQQHVEGSKTVSDIGTELCMYLPVKETKSFSTLFKYLDEQIEKKKILVQGYGVSVTTMEEVFLKAGQSQDLLAGSIEMQQQRSDLTEKCNINFLFGVAPEEVDIRKTSIIVQNDKPQGNEIIFSKNSLFFTQLSALFMKRVHYARRDIYSFLCNTLVPVTIFCVGLIILKIQPFFEEGPELVISAKNWNIEYMPQSFLPIVELSSVSKQYDYDFGRFNRQENFPQFVLQKPFSNATVDIANRSLFGRQYEHGKSLECTSYFRCPQTAQKSMGNTILDMGNALINPTEDFQLTNIEERNGASIFAASIVQPKLAVQKDGRCFIANVKVDFSLSGTPFSVNYEAQTCSDRTSPCLMIEGTLLNIRQCIPLGCLSDLNQKSLESFFIGYNINSIESLERALNTTDANLLQCDGNLCNSGPASVFGPNICRGLPAGSGFPLGNPQCITDDLDRLVFNFSYIGVDKDENGKVDLEESIGIDIGTQLDMNANYCSERHFIDSNEVSFPNSVQRQDIDVNGEYETDGHNNGDETGGPRKCLDSGLTNTIQLILSAIAAGDLPLTDSNFTIIPSFDPDNNGCTVKELDCELAVLPTNSGNICVADSCVSNKTEIFQGLLGEVGAPFVSLLLENAVRIPCEDRVKTCNATADIRALYDLSNGLGKSGWIEFLNGGDLLTLLGLDAIATTIPQLKLNTKSIPIQNRVSSTFRLLEFDRNTRRNDNAQHFSKPFLKLNQNLAVHSVSSNIILHQHKTKLETGENCYDYCLVKDFGGKCVNITCDDQVLDTTKKLFGPIAGQLFADYTNSLPGVSCNDSNGIASFSCDTIVFITDIEADLVNESLYSLTYNQTAVSETTIALLKMYAQLQLGEFPTINGLTELVNTINGFEHITSNDILSAVNQVNAYSILLINFLNDPKLFLQQVSDFMSSVENLESVCANPIDECLLTQFNATSFGIGVLCLPAGCSEEVVAFNSTVDAISNLGEILDGEVNLFLCNSSNCNFGCYSPSNCETSKLRPVQIDHSNHSDSQFIKLIDFEDLCFVVPNFRIGYTALINSTAKFAVPIVVNEMHTALLRRSLVEYFILGDTHLELGTGDSMGNKLYYEAGVHGNASTTFIFEERFAPRITVSNHPLPNTAKVEELIQAIMAFTSSMFCLLAFAFVPGPMISFVVMEKEEEVQIKHLQFVSGASIPAYWLANYSFDFLVYMIPFTFSLILIKAFDIKSFIENGAFLAVAIVFLGYGLAVIPFSYLCGHLFQKHTTALIWIIIINCITGLALMIISFALDQIPRTEHISPQLKWLFRLFPGFCLGDSLLQISTLSLVKSYLGDMLNSKGFYSIEVAGANIIYLLLEGFLFLAAVIVIEYSRTHSSRWHPCGRMKNPDIGDQSLNDIIDADVLSEEKRVLQQEEWIQRKRRADPYAEVQDLEHETTEDVVRLVNLRKVFTNGKVAIRNLSLGIPEGQCFGYLGINGAGKTTTMKCITGDIFPTSGSGYLKGFNIAKEQTKVRQHVGYCSQFSSILGLLTVREHLVLFSKIKHVNNIDDTVHTLLKRLSLFPFQNKLACSLSGGNKRKLSVAIAMIGSPAVMLLDEPSTGMDVASRRFMWNVIENMSQGKYDGRKTSVILTTHSMEECEALCSRVGIMVGGRLQCIGSVQHLKSRFGSGFTIEIKLRFIDIEEIESIIKSFEISPEITANTLLKVCQTLGNASRHETLKNNDHGAGMPVLKRLNAQGSINNEFFVEWFLQQEKVDKLKHFLISNFDEVEVVEAHEYKLRFKIAKNENTRLSRIFDVLETHKQELHISEYAVSQTTLEQIFNGFASQQDDDDERKKAFSIGLETNEDAGLKTAETQATDRAIET